MRRLAVVLVATLAVLAGVVANAHTGTAAAKEGFIRMFPGLPPEQVVPVQQLANLAQAQLDPNLDADNNPEGLLSGFTYFGQFLDHDSTLDTSPPPQGPVDPTTLANSRTLAFDLDSVYGNDTTLFDAGKFKLAPSGTDYVRRADGSAVIPEARNDENQIIAQVQVAIMRAHNRLVDQGYTFDQARQVLVAHYQAAIEQDYLPHVLSPTDPKVVAKLDPKKHGTPIEFSVAAFRFGHTQVRRAYELTDTTGKIQVFSATAPDLRGGRPLPPDRVIDWGLFFPQLTDAADLGHTNISRKVDTLISSSLFVLPIPGAEATGSNVLAFRNLTRGMFYGLPSGQTLAAELGLPVYTPHQLGTDAYVTGDTPLWYYVLAESAITTGGARLGPLGSTIVQATFDAEMRNGDHNVKHQPKDLDPAIVGPDGAMTISDLLRLGGVA
jgi:hypothetical protein